MDENFRNLIFEKGNLDVQYTVLWWKINNIWNKLIFAAKPFLLQNTVETSSVYTAEFSSTN